LFFFLELQSYNDFTMPFRLLVYMTAIFESNIYVDENIFDDPLWLTNPEIFFKVHPNIDLETVKHVEATCLKLKENKVNIEYNVPFFLL